MRYADNECTYTEEYDAESNCFVYVYTGPCLLTGKETTVRVKANELHAYRRGAKIQDAMVSLSPEEREFLMSGYCDEAWDQMFGNPDEDEEIDCGRFD
jgi:hypothetical protein